MVSVSKVTEYTYENPPSGERGGAGLSGPYRFLHLLGRCGLLGEGLDGLGGKADALAVNRLRLKVDGELALGGDIGVAA